MAAEVNRLTLPSAPTCATARLDLRFRPRKASSVSRSCRAADLKPDAARPRAGGPPEATIGCPGPAHAWHSGQSRVAVCREQRPVDPTKRFPRRVAQGSAGAQVVQPVVLAGIRPSWAEQIQRRGWTVGERVSMRDRVAAQGRSPSGSSCPRAGPTPESTSTIEQGAPGRRWRRRRSAGQVLDPSVRFPGEVPRGVGFPVGHVVELPTHHHGHGFAIEEVPACVAASGSSSPAWYTSAHARTHRRSSSSPRRPVEASASPTRARARADAVSRRLGAGPVPVEWASNPNEVCRRRRRPSREPSSRRPWRCRRTLPGHRILEASTGRLMRQIRERHRPPAGG